MSLDYKFLLLASDASESDTIKEAISEHFGNIVLHETPALGDAVDFCKANVYDLVIASTNGLDLDLFTQKLRQLNNDNKTTGILVIGSGHPISSRNFSNVMQVESIGVDDWAQYARVLISLK